MFAMLNCEEQKAVGRRQKAACEATLGDRRLQLRGLVFCLLLTAFCLLAVSCRRDMQDQPKAIAYRESTFFKDGVASRPPVEGTVPRGYLRADREFYFGKKPNTGVRSGPLSTPNASAPSTAQASSTNTTAMFPDDVESFPFPIS